MRAEKKKGLSAHTLGLEIGAAKGLLEYKDVPHDVLWVPKQSSTV
jgi:hypothetical protein